MLSLSVKLSRNVDLSMGKYCLVGAAIVVIESERYRLFLIFYSGKRHQSVATLVLVLPNLINIFEPIDFTHFLAC